MMSKENEKICPMWMQSLVTYRKKQRQLKEAFSAGVIDGNEPQQKRPSAGERTNCIRP